MAREHEPGLVQAASDFLDTVPEWLVDNAGTFNYGDVEPLAWLAKMHSRPNLASFIMLVWAANDPEIFAGHEESEHEAIEQELIDDWGITEARVLRARLNGYTYPKD